MVNTNMKIEFMKQVRRWSFLALPSLVLCTALLTACGTPNTSTSSTASSSATATPTACLSTTTGTIQSINGSTLQITNLQGQSVQATFTSQTSIIQQKTLTPTQLQTGEAVLVAVKQNSDNTYSAVTVTVRNAQVTTGSRQGRGSGSIRLCSGQRRTRGSGNGTGANTGTGRQTINGTVSTVSGNTLTITDASGGNYTMQLTSTTRISTQETTLASALHTGEAVTVTGIQSGSTGISASSISVLQTLPKKNSGRPSSTPTATNS